MTTYFYLHSDKPTPKPPTYEEVRQSKIVVKVTGFENGKLAIYTVHQLSHEWIFFVKYHPKTRRSPRRTWKYFSSVGRVVKGAIVATTYAGKRAWWLLGRLYAKKDK